VGKSGSSNSRITIKPSLVTGHLGKVVLKGAFYTDYSYITVDGLDKYRFVFNVLGGGYIVRVTGTADFFEFKNVCLFTKFDTSNAWGTLFYANNAHLLIKGCWFHDTNSEDQIKYNGNGTLIIEDSYFSGLAEHGAIHEDVCQLDVANVDTVIVRRCIFANQGTDCFMMAPTLIAYAEYDYDVFLSGGDAIKPLACGSLVANNCVFNTCRAFIVYQATPTTVKNCICNGTSSWGGSVYAGSGQ
jgi:hypothetical protein